MFSQELKDYEYETLIRQGKITNIGEAIRKLNKEYFKIWMKMYYPDVNPQFLEDCYKISFFFREFHHSISFQIFYSPSTGVSISTVPLMPSSLM